MDPFDVLDGHRYVRLITFRKNGEPVPTPVWFARVGRALYVVTGRRTGKAKRIRNNARVVIAPCDFIGRQKGPDVRATARLTGQRADDPADRALRRKYGWQYGAFKFVEGLFGSSEDLVFLELRAPGAEG